MSELTSTTISNKIVTAKCCLAKRIDAVIEKEKQGFDCKHEKQEISDMLLLIDSIQGYVPEGEIIDNYNIGCEISFAGNTLVVSAEITNEVYYQMYDSVNAPEVGSTIEFTDSTSGTNTTATDTVIPFTYTFTDTELIIDYSGNIFTYPITYDKFLNTVFLFDVGAENAILICQWLGTPTFTNCTLVEVEAPKPCLTLLQVENALNKLTKGCECCGESSSLPAVEFSDSPAPIITAPTTFPIFGVVASSGTITTIQNNLMIGKINVVVFMGTEVPNANYTFNSTTGTITFTFTLTNDADYTILVYG